MCLGWVVRLGGVGEVWSLHRGVRKQDGLHAFSIELLKKANYSNVKDTLWIFGVATFRVSVMYCRRFKTLLTGVCVGE